VALGALRGPSAPTRAAQAAKERKEDVVRLLVRHGAPVGAATAHGITALHLAVIEGADEVGRVLLAHGADPHQPDADGETPFSLASRAVKAAVFNYVE